MGVPGFMLPLVILLEFGGGLAILFGFLTCELSDVHEKLDHRRRFPAAGYHRPRRI